MLVVGMQELHMSGQFTLIVDNVQTPSSPWQLAGSGMPLHTGVVVVELTVVLVCVAVDVVFVAVVDVTVAVVVVGVVDVPVVVVVVLVVRMHESHSTGQSNGMPGMLHCALLSAEHCSLSYNPLHVPTKLHVPQRCGQLTRKLSPIMPVVLQKLPMVSHPGASGGTP